MKEIKVLIIDEYPDVRERLARRLEAVPGLKVVAQTGNPLLAAELARSLRPDVILADFKRRGPSRVEMFRWIGTASPPSRLVVYTSYLGDLEEKACMQAGAAACLLKGMSVRDLAKELEALVSRDGRCAEPAAGSGGHQR